MSIQPEYRGLWQGEVTKDSKRAKPYPGVICLNADGGYTIYQLPRYQETGLTKGELTKGSENDGCMVLTEVLYEGAKSWGSGTLSLKLIGEDRLECRWHGRNGNSNAVFTRPASTDPKPD